VRGELRTAEGGAIAITDLSLNRGRLTFTVTDLARVDQAISLLNKATAPLGVGNAREVEISRGSVPGQVIVTPTAAGIAAAIDGAMAQAVEVIRKRIDELNFDPASVSGARAPLRSTADPGTLQFELFRPGQIAVRDYYAELPIVLRVSGKYHDIGAFASDIANLSRIVTLNNLTVLPRPDGALTMDATAKTFRYLDPQEVVAQRKVAGGAKK
jgi:hypothetical protein